MAARTSTCDVVVIGCGVPQRSMGWYHAQQLLDGRCPSARLAAIVEPFLLGPGVGSEAGEAFARFRSGLPGDVQVYSAVSDLPARDPSVPRLALVGGRTADNPRSVREAIAAGCTHVYLEKPGATTLGELEALRDFAAAQGVPIWMGFNKNVSQYVSKALAFEAECGEAVSKVTFLHYNDVTEDALDECFERNCEGLLKNMCIHELGILTAFYDVREDTVASVTTIPELTRRETRGAFTDFRCVGIRIRTKAGREFGLVADRCGPNGNYCAARVELASGKELLTDMSDKAAQQAAAELEARLPGCMSYFYQQDPDYATLKELCAAHAAQGLPGTPKAVPTIDVAVQALKLAEMFERELSS